VEAAGQLVARVEGVGAAPVRRGLGPGPRLRTWGGEGGWRSGRWGGSWQHGGWCSTREVQAGTPMPSKVQRGARTPARTWAHCKYVGPIALSVNSSLPPPLLSVSSLGVTPQLHTGLWGHIRALHA